jgi:hypothetical protein
MWARIVTCTEKWKNASKILIGNTQRERTDVDQMKIVQYVLE